MKEKPTTIYGRFAALPARQRVLIGVVGMTLSSWALYFDSLATKPDEFRSPVRINRGSGDSDVPPAAVPPARS